MKAKAGLKQTKLKRDIDDFDHYFDHILVFDNKIKGSFHNKVIGTYRLNRGIKITRKNCFTLLVNIILHHLLKIKVTF